MIFIFFHGSAYDHAYCDGCNNLDTSDQFGKDIDVQVVRNNNLCSDYDDDNNDLLYHLDSISSMPDPYSNKQWNQLNHHDYSEQDLYGPLKHVYNRNTYYGSNISRYILSIMLFVIQVQVVEIEEDLIVQGLEKRSRRRDTNQKGSKSNGKIYLKMRTECFH